MIVQCDECNARFKLDDSKVSDQGTKVRCAKCKHIFLVRKESPADEPDYDSLFNGLVPSPEGAGTQATSAGDTNTRSVPEEIPPSTVVPPPLGTDIEFGSVDFSSGADAVDETEGGFDFGEITVDSTPALPGDGEGPSSFDFGEVDFQIEAAPEAPPKDVPGFDFGEVDFDSGMPPVTAPDVQAEFDMSQFDADNEVSFATPAEPAGGDFDFDEPAPSDDPAYAAVADPSPLAPHGGVEEQSHSGPEVAFDFGEFDMGGGEDQQPAPGGPAVSTDANPFALHEERLEEQSPAQQLASTGPDEFSFGDGESFPPVGGSAGRAFSFETAEPASTEFAAPPAPIATSISPATAEQAGDVPFDFGDFNFDEREDTQKNGQDEFDVSNASGVPIYADDLPPLSISSRRKGSSLLSIPVISFLVLLLVAVGGGGYFVYAKGAAGLNSVGLGFLAKKLGVGKDEGSIAVRNAAAQFLRNTQAVEMFVVKGEAFNSFKDSRADIQVKATLFGAKGEVLMQKNVYCGNTLTDEQVVTMSPADLEKVMAKPFGDSLSNLAVQPGKAIPFAVVFSNVPKEAADFGVEVVGSTVAAK